jgi:hypothetical protein
MPGYQIQGTRKWQKVRKKDCRAKVPGGQPLAAFEAPLAARPRARLADGTRSIIPQLQ